MPHQPGHPPEQPQVTRRSAFDAFTDDVRQTLEGNPIFEALNAVSDLASGSQAGALGAFFPSPAGPASGAARGLAARGTRSTARPMERILENPQFRRKVFRDVGTEGARRVRKYIGAGRAPDEALSLAKKELRAKRLHDTLETFEKTGHIVFGGGGRKPDPSNIVRDVGGGAIAGETNWIMDAYQDSQ